jgi:hypothetical protein
MALSIIRIARFAAIAALLSGCASQATQTQLDYARRVCATNPTGSAQECASIPALQAEANAEANHNGMLAAAAIVLLPLYILVAAAGSGSDGGYHHHYYHHHR